MTEATQYQTRLHSYTEGKNFLAMQEDAIRILAQLIDGVADSQLTRRPAPEKWSVVEIIAHLAEDELATSWRYRQMLESSGCALAGFDQDQWARLGDYAAWSPPEALQMFQLLREANLRMLRRLTEEEWDKFGIHAERGKITVRDLARHMAGHDINHVDQIRAILNATE
jgi:hypothetical protein